MALTHRKRVFAIRRAPDGSAFQKCETCGASVAIALSDMHHCEKKMDTKRFKGLHGMRSVPQSDYQKFRTEPRSPYRLFMESFMKDCNKENAIEMDRAGFEKWKSMSDEEKQHYVCYARILDYNHQQTLNQEAKKIIKVKDAADSAQVGKIYKADKGLLFNCFIRNPFPKVTETESSEISSSEDTDLGSLEIDSSLIRKIEMEPSSEDTESSETESISS